MTANTPGGPGDPKAPSPTPTSAYGWAPVRSPLDVGPVLTLPTVGFLLAGLAAGVAVGALMWSFVAAFKPAASPSIVWGLIGVWAAQIAGLVALMPWKPRHLGRWPFSWLIGRGVSFAGVLIAAALLYSATRPDPLVFGLTTASSYFAVLLSEVAVYARYVRSRTGPPAG